MKKERPPSLATQLSELAISKYELFHDPDQKAYATYQVKGHRETWPISSEDFRNTLSKLCFDELKKIPYPQVLSAAIGVMDATAKHKGKEHKVYLRTANKDGKYYLDLGSPTWEVIEFDSSSWRILPQSPIKFRRPKGLHALPIPVGGGELNKLREFLNLDTPSDWHLLLPFLLWALLPDATYPVLVLNGEQGSAKSTTARIIKCLLDPSAASLRAEPREGRDLIITANNSWVIALDNISAIPLWLSDALCRLSTGGGFATRKLYTDSEEFLFDGKRVILLTGIEDIVTRGDLLDRSIIFWLPVIPPEKRQTEKSLWQAFDDQKSSLFGALLDCLVNALAEFPKVQLGNLPRMADFAQFGVATERILGWPNGTFMDAYATNRKSANQIALEATPVTEAIYKFADKNDFQGTLTQFLALLGEEVPEDVRRSRYWPKTPQGLRNILKRIAPSLRADGIEFTQLPRTDKKRLVRIEKVGNQSSLLSVLQESFDDNDDDNDNTKQI